MWSVRIPKFQTGSRLVSVSATEGIHFVFYANPYSLWHMRSYSWMIKSQLHVKQVCLLSIIIYQMLQAKKKMTFEKNCESSKFSKNNIIAIRFSHSFVHPWLFLCWLHYLYLLFRFARLLLCLTQFDGGFHCLSFDNFMTQLL